MSGLIAETIVGGLSDIKQDSNIMLRNEVEHNSTLLNQLVEWELHSLINACSDHTSSDLWLLTHKLIVSN